jgi:hypothetical protein
MEPCEKLMHPAVLELARRAGFTGPAMENTQIGTNHMSALTNLVELVAEECARMAGGSTAGGIMRRFGIREQC